MEGGHPGPTSKKHFSAINKRLQTLIQSYERAEDNEDEDDDENDKGPFLRSVARNIEFNPVDQSTSFTPAMRIRTTSQSIRFSSNWYSQYYP
ncbi:hypothetical protein ACOMHN_021784 [Nucella lapillus]